MHPEDYYFVSNYDDLTLVDKIRQNKRWGTADGRTLRIGDMTNDHIVNCIFWVRQRPEVYSKDILQMFLDEANYRKLSWYIPEDFTAKKALIKQIQAMVIDGVLMYNSLDDLKRLKQKLKLVVGPYQAPESALK